MEKEIGRAFGTMGEKKRNADSAMVGKPEGKETTWKTQV
jgi:hypothetical protein